MPIYFLHIALIFCKTRYFARTSLHLSGDIERLLSWCYLDGAKILTCLNKNIMKKILLTAFSVLCLLAAQAQITVTSSVFASVGDDLKTRSATNMGGAVVGAAGANMTWDYSMIVGGPLEVSTIQAASAGAAAALFPDADIILPQGIVDGENYIKVSANKAEAIGLSGDPLGLGFNLPIRFSDPKSVLETPITYPGSYTDYCSFTVAIDVDDYPTLRNLVDSLVPPSTGATIDSIRIVYNDTTINDIDSWGSLKIPAYGLANDTYNVLRVKQTTNSSIRVDVKGRFFNIPFDWTDPSQPPLSTPLPFAGPQTTVLYQFLNDVEKEPILILNANDPADATRITSAVFKSELSSNTSFAAPAPVVEPTVKAFPNPVITDLNLELDNFKAGRYEVRVYNIIGREVLREQHQVSGNTRLSVNVTSLRQGTYLYSIVDSDGQVIKTRRIMVARP